MRTITITAVVFTIMAILFFVAGNAVESFAASIDGSNGVMGSAYTANP